MKKMLVGVLGPEGTFSESAVLSWARKKGERIELRYYDTISDAVEVLSKNEVEYSVVPIENSLEGSVGETLDALSREDVVIVGEILQPIEMCLVGRCRSLEEVKIIFSHPHALAQCRNFIRRLKGVKIRQADSTTHAAKLASESQTNGVAALSSESSAHRYNLDVLAYNVQDRESITRFVILEKAPHDKDKLSAPSPATGNDKTSILIYIKDRPGALYDILGEFANRNINLTKIESRPSKKALGDYMFYVDCDGHVEEKAVRDALLSIDKKVKMLKFLGSYPKA